MAGHVFEWGWGERRDEGRVLVPRSMTLWVLGPSQVHTVEAGPGPGPEPSCLHELCPELEWGAPSGIGRGPFPSYTPFWVSSPWTPAAAVTLQVSVDGSLPLACPLAPLR